MFLKMMYITNNTDIAQIAESAGVDRIWIDLETLGKNERQANINSVKSNHQIEDISVIKPLLSKAEMLVRINPINKDSKEEIDKVICAGADIIMLPMWKTKDEVKTFIKYADKRARVCLLLETKEAAQCLDEVLALKGIDEIHIGLNDLHISYGLTFMFELLANGTVERLCTKIKEKGIPYGFGGIAKLDEGLLPARKIIAEHYRLGSCMAILSRSFCNSTQEKDLSNIRRDFTDGIKKIREFEGELEAKPFEYFALNRKEVADLTEAIVFSLKNKVLV